MPTVELSRTAQELTRIPALCVKTGVPTEDSVRLTGSATPGWTGAMVLFGIFAWLFASLMAGRRYELVLPFRREVLRRYRGWRRAGHVLLGSGVVMVAVAAFAGRDDAFALLGVSVVGALFLLVNEWVNAVGVRLSPDGALRVTRVHPDFERAWRDQNR